LVVPQGPRRGNGDRDQASLASGLSANFGTMTRPLHVGHAARNGVLAAKLAQAGYTANSRALQAARGLLRRVLLRLHARPPAVRRARQVLRHGDARPADQAVPLGGLTHTAIDAALHPRERHDIRPEMVESVEVDAMEATFNTIAFRVTKAGIEGKF